MGNNDMLGKRCCQCHHGQWGPYTSDWCYKQSCSCCTWIE